MVVYGEVVCVLGAVPGEEVVSEFQPLYVPRFVVMHTETALSMLDADVPFENRIEARSECFMADGERTYTYGQGRNARTYYSTPLHPLVREIMAQLNDRGLAARYFNVCVLNRYAHDRQALGWHSDDSPEQDQSHPIAVVSFGEPREIWTRKIGDKGPVPPENRYLLEPGSLFVMPGGYQQTHQHRIPKAGRDCGLRISLTFRKLDR